MEAKAKEREALASRTSGTEALDHAIAAAELYMKASKAASGLTDKKRLGKKCEELVTRAESLKKAASTVDTVSAVEKRLRLPRQTRQIPTSEKNLLYRNSRLHGNVFPPWESDPGDAGFNGPPFSDPAKFSLSTKQREVFNGWKRPRELINDRAKADPGELDTGALMIARDDYDLVQDITTDCSVVASLCASIKQLRPGPNSVMPILMFPSDSESGHPKSSSNGKYVFRMFFNGCFRKVIIDDTLPSSSNSRTLYVVDRQNPALLWPALMEKAYLKVRGGYDFPGSNSGTDLCVLTGWIPQQLFIQSDDVDWNATWKRVKKAYDYGDVVVTLGTGRLSSDEEEAMGLAGEHDYAVLDISEKADHRRLLVKNPWCDGLVWKGVGSSSKGYTPDDDEHPVKLKPGSFWISFDDVTQNFESLYLNWNPSLFTQRQDHHFSWPLPDANMIGSFAHNPQYSFTAATDDQVWILLSRHFQDEELDIALKRTSSSTLAAVSNMLGFTSLYIFASDGKRVQLGDKSVYRGPFVDSPQTLAPFEAKKGTSYTVVVASQDLPLPTYSFTLSFFSRSTLNVAPAQHPLKHYTEVQGSWTRRTAGGNSESATYLTNPQFRLALTQAGPLSLLLSTANQDIPVHVDLVWASGQRVTAVTVRDLVGTSGDYRRGCAVADVANVDRGTYTVVCSTFEPGQLGDFTLRVGSDIPCALTPVLADAAGRLRNNLPLLTFRAGETAKRAMLSVARLTKASVVVTRRSSTYSPVQSGTSTPRSHAAVRLTLETGRGPNKHILASTSTGPSAIVTSSEQVEFREVGLGLRTGEFDVDPRVTRGQGLWLVVETMGTGTGIVGDAGGGGEALAVEVLSDGHVAVGAWELVDV
ncbi:hypothetical protein F5Y15DRAFT_143905 [Xylariaceae sp. FL0016]|nr:hypothetical protein F5Y15DRAFT_143905 [Xylariaceae sp. FL0016]